MRGQLQFSRIGNWLEIKLDIVKEYAASENTAEDISGGYFEQVHKAGRKMMSPVSPIEWTDATRYT